MIESDLHQMQNQKNNIVQEIARLSKAIDIVKEQDRPKSLLRRREEIAHDREAHRKAINFITQQKLKKKELLDRRRQQDEKTVAFLKQQIQEEGKRREMYESTLREEKRRAISIRLSETRAKREELRTIEKETNQLVSKLIREDPQARQRPESPEDLTIKVVQRRPHVDFAELHKHEQEYLQRKEDEKKKDRSASISHPVKKFHKSKWAEIIDEEEGKQKEEEKQKEVDMKMRIEKRVKYGELINSLFVKKGRVHTDQGQQNYANKSKSIYVIPPSKLPPSTAAKPQKTEDESSNRAQKMKKLINSHNNSIKREEKPSSPEDRSKEKERLQRERQIRKETTERLKKIDSELLQKTASEPQPKYQSNFQNYLGHIKLKKKEGDHNWSSILTNDDLSREEKYTQLLRSAVTLESKAKIKESLKDNPDEAVDLYLNSIQVKLAILESI